MDRLLPLVLFFQLLLHIKVQLSLALDSLLFHISDYALVHGLGKGGLVSGVQQSIDPGGIGAHPSQTFAGSGRRQQWRL